MIPGRPMSEAPRDGTVIIVSISNTFGVPASGHYAFERIKWGTETITGWQSAEHENHHYGEKCFLAWWPDNTPESEMEKRPRTDWRWQPSNGTEGADFMEQYCFQCVHDRAHQLDENDPGCDVLCRTMAYSPEDDEYPVEFSCESGERICTKFLRYVEEELKFDEHGNEILPTPRCTETKDLFG